MSDEGPESEAAESVRPINVEVGDVDEEDFEDIECQEKESEEARDPIVLRDPGSPTPREIEEHNVTHMPFRSWCPHCVSGKAKERHHKKQTDADKKNIPEIVFDYCFLGWDEWPKKGGLRWCFLMLCHEKG